MGIHAGITYEHDNYWKTSCKSTLWLCKQDNQFQNLSRLGSVSSALTSIKQNSESSEPTLPFFTTKLTPLEISQERFFFLITKDNPPLSFLTSNEEHSFCRINLCKRQHAPGSIFCGKWTMPFCRKCSTAEKFRTLSFVWIYWALIPSAVLGQQTPYANRVMGDFSV